MPARPPIPKPKQQPRRELMELLKDYPQQESELGKKVLKGTSNIHDLLVALAADGVVKRDARGYWHLTGKPLPNVMTPVKTRGRKLHGRHWRKLDTYSFDALLSAMR